MGIKYIYEIAKIKKEMDPDLKTVSLESTVSMIVSQAKLFGVRVEVDQVKPVALKINMKI